MKDGEDGFPRTGASNKMLGARPNADIEVDEEGHVHPVGEGMSVAPDDPNTLLHYRRPAEFGGTGREPVWVIDSADLGGDLEYLQDSSTHGVVAPMTEMTFEAYQEAIFETREFWSLA
jgi:hypothetical protein